MAIFKALKSIFRKNDPHCAWMKNVIDRLKKFSSIENERWKYDLIWQEYMN